MDFFFGIFRYLALMSGLNLGKSDDAGNSMLGPLELAVSWLTGQGGDMPTQEQMSKVDRVILAGNCLAPETRDNDDNTARYLTKNKDATSIGNKLEDWGMTSVDLSALNRAGFFVIPQIFSFSLNYSRTSIEEKN